jgi:DNA-damage-inducible protein D
VSEDRSRLPFDEEGGHLIRRQWHDGRWFFSVVDVVSLLTDTDAPRRYWSDLKRKLQSEGFEPYDGIVQLKMRSLDGKKRETNERQMQPT